VAFFATEGGRGERRVFAQMGQILGIRPIETLTLFQRDVERGLAAGTISAFATSLQQDLSPRGARSSGAVVGASHPTVS
jgi:hypothetical protein